MRAAVRGALLAVVVGLTAVQFVRPDTSNPPVDHAKSLWADRSVDPKVAGILRRACADCHSHETKWPWYARVSPMSWMMDRHVKDGRAKLNFSDWSGSSQDQAEEIYDSVAKGKMPMQGYLLLHPEARLSKADQETLQAWADGKLAMAARR
jgi:hypothetical protein